MLWTYLKTGVGFLLVIDLDPRFKLGILSVNGAFVVQLTSYITSIPVYIETLIFSKIIVQGTYFVKPMSLQLAWQGCRNLGSGVFHSYYVYPE